MPFGKHFNFKSHRLHADTPQNHADAKKHQEQAEQQDHDSNTNAVKLCESCSNLITTVTSTRAKLNRPSLLCQNQSTLYELTHSQCRLCQLFGQLKMEVVHTLPNGQQTRLLPSRLLKTRAPLHSGQVKFQSIYILNPDSADYDPLKSSPLLVFQEADQQGHFRGIGTFGVVHRMFENDALKPRRVEPLTIESNILRKWLVFCEENHQDMCRPITSRSVAGFKVLDCQTRCVIRPDVGCRYVALSYTWGLGVPEQAQGSFPRTIEDSILITLQLGFRYLWIDKYCIDQTDANEKHTQIQQMDTIYSMAELTIVAAAGNNPNYGLPGVSTRARKEQKRLVLDDVELLQIHSDSQDLRLSPWASRAWTLQEGYLAKRRLIFTDREVLFLCENMHCQESVEQNLHHRTSHTGGSWDGLDGSHLFGVIPNRKSKSFKTDRLLTEYSRRILSFDADALNACLGILKATQISHWFGLPVELDTYKSEQKYTLDLQWRSSARSHHRPGFPSWSWASISGPKTFPGYHSQYAHDCTISVQTPNDEWLTIDEWMQSGGDHAILKDTHCLRIHSYVWTPEFEIDKKTGEILAKHVGRSTFQFRVALDVAMKDTIGFLSDAVCLLLQLTREDPPWTSTIALILKPFGDRYRRVGITDWNRRVQLSKSYLEELGIEKRTLFVE